MTVSEEKTIQKLSNEDLNISSGATTIYNPAGKYDIMMTCPHCKGKFKLDSQGALGTGVYTKEWTCMLCTTNNVSTFSFEKNNVLSNYVNGTTFTKDEIRNMASKQQVTLHSR